MTFAEFGYDIDLGTWRAVFAPKNTPVDIIRILESTCAEVIQSDDFTSFMHNGGYNISYKNAQDFARMMDEQHQIYKDLTPVIFAE
jgi:tripartite-type tricarboxylate transporter receptor subunit TctC